MELEHNVKVREVSNTHKNNLLQQPHHNHLNLCERNHFNGKLNEVKNDKFL